MVPSVGASSSSGESGGMRKESFSLALGAGEGGPGSLRALASTVAAACWWIRMMSRRAWLLSEMMGGVTPPSGSDESAWFVKESLSFSRGFSTAVPGDSGSV